MSTVPPTFRFRLAVWAEPLRLFFENFLDFENKEEMIVLEKQRIIVFILLFLIIFLEETTSGSLGRTSATEDYSNEKLLLKRSTFLSSTDAINIPLFYNYKFDLFDVKGNSLADYRFSNPKYDAHLQNDASIDASTLVEGTGSILLKNGGYITIDPEFPFTSSSAGLTITLWFKYNGRNQNIPEAKLFTFGNGISTGSISFSILKGPMIENKQVFPLSNFQPLVLTDGRWHFLALQISSTQAGTSVKFSIDDDSIYQAIYSGPFQSISRSVNFIGRGYNTSESTFIGNLDDFRVYSGILTENQLNQVYRNGNPTTSSTDLNPPSRSTAESSNTKNMLSTILTIVGVGICILTFIAWRYSTQLKASQANLKKVLFSRYFCSVKPSSVRRTSSVSPQPREEVGERITRDRDRPIYPTDSPIRNPEGTVAGLRTPVQSQPETTLTFQPMFPMAAAFQLSSFYTITPRRVVPLNNNFYLSPSVPVATSIRKVEMVDP